MTTAGQRKAAMYLAALSPSERRELLGGLPRATSRGLAPLVEQIERLGWNHRPAIERALEDELRGLTVDTTLSVEALIALADRLPPPWYARVIAAAGPVDHEFLLALLETRYADLVREALRTMPPLPPRLAKAVLAEAMAVSDGRGGACAA